ncbi:phosphate-starvation-inducible protein PsiE [Bacillus taeanensis]|uniref:Protein PsiE n=1 Tax=Bacillus taeanensis TaxID=273032 RepID=A0A366XWD6_9BACI|nr:phosphate-starvation-inducible protein PsiE [Bacillus taeanensis]RBW70720.1 phosphate-starvation-inducible protein PsiE [Bacillus taeanensis]
MKETLKIEGSKTVLDSIRIPAFQLTIPMILQFVLNTSLIMLAAVLSVLMTKEVLYFIEFVIISEETNFHHFLEKILVFFLYFEFISMIVKYFREDYHFPMRYFLYIGITAMIRLIIVHHQDPLNTLLYSCVILILILSYYIINKTPSKRTQPNHH